MWAKSMKHKKLQFSRYTKQFKKLMNLLLSDVWIEEKKMFPPLTENIPEKDCGTFSISQTDITLQEFLINLSAIYHTITIYLTI